MADEGSSSSSSSNLGWTYDVFVSFTGEDTRYSFTGNLCNALEQRGFNVFRDDTGLRRGEEISFALLKAIEESRIAIIVFSENYASSSWCLDELVKIIECMKEMGQLVRPVFYYVNPSDVRHQRGSYGKSMALHEAKPNISKERVHKWRVALTQAANLSGWPFKNGYEFEFIQSITEEISSQLNRILLHIADHPVGLKYRILEVMSLLSMKSVDDVRMVGIHGIGGIGKTTIARAVYNSIANQFQGSSFLADVRENSIKHGLEQLQETLLFDLLGEKIIKIIDVNKAIPIIEKRLRRKKVLLILDDVDNLQQLRSLAGRCDWFGSGSRIIITTRDKHLLLTHGVEKLYEVKELNDNEALQLFSWNAFKRSEPDASYVEIANRVVQYAKGLPLALNIIGGDLFGKTIEEWESALKKYERIPSKEILNVLKVSYDNLDDNEKEIFLDIACFFKGNLLEDVEKTLDASRFYSKYGIGVLKDKSLVTIDEINRVKMHDLIQDLGRDIARKDSPFNPGQRRRLWHHEDVLEVITKNTGTETIEGIVLDMPNLQQEVQLKANAFKKMKRLRVLIVRNAQISAAPKHLPNNLRLLDWKSYPSSSLPSDFHPETLVVLNLPHSSLTMDKPLKKFEHLTLMNFSDCDSITRVPDVSATPNLTKLLANNCPNLTEIPDSVGHLDKLVILSTEKCPKLKTCPSGMRSKSLESINLGQCSNIQRFPDILAEMRSMKRIDIEGTAIKRLPNSIEKLGGLEELNLTSCSSLEDLPTNVDMFQNIEELKVESCPQLPKLLGNSLLNWTDRVPILNNLVLRNCDLSDEDLQLIISRVLNLKWLTLSENNIVTLPACIQDLVHLLFLFLDNCKKLRNISVLPPYLQYIDARNCISLTPMSSNVLLSQAFQEVDFIDIVVLRKKIPTWFDHSSKGGSVVFWVRHKFPAIAVFFLLGGECESNKDFPCGYCLLINGHQVFHGKRGWPVDHVWLSDLRIHFTNKEWPGLKDYLKPGWNHVEIKCKITNGPPNVFVKCSGIHLYKENMDIHDVSFVYPDDNMHDDDLDIYDEASNDIVFTHLLRKYLIADLMKNFRSSKRKTNNDNEDEDEDEEEDDEDEDLELDNDDTLEMKQEQGLTSANHEIPENSKNVVEDKGKGIMVQDNSAKEKKSKQGLSLSPQKSDEKTCHSVMFDTSGGKTREKGVKSSKICLDPSTEAEEEPPFDRIHERPSKLKGKFKEDENLLTASTSAAPTSRNTRVVKLTESKHNQAQASYTQLHENRVDHIDSTINEDNIKAFYDFLEAEISNLALLQNTTANNDSLTNGPSEKTQKALRDLEDLVSNKFYLLLDPVTSGSMKNTMEYLLRLSPEDGVSLGMKSVIMQLSKSFHQWTTEYKDANLKLGSATSDLAKVGKLENGLEINLKEFREFETLENRLCNELADLEAKKRELEEEINKIRAEIEDLKDARDTAGERKREVYENGRRLKAERDGLRNRVPRLKAEQEWANKTQENIETEWSKLAELFVQSAGFQ